MNMLKNRVLRKSAPYLLLDPPENENSRMGMNIKGDMSMSKNWRGSCI